MKLKYSYIIAIMFIILYSLDVNSSPVIGFKLDKATSPAEDSIALVVLYNQTNGALWSNPWNLTEPMEMWDGVILNEDRRVTGIFIDNRDLDGSLPNELGSLSELEDFFITNNANLTGQLHEEYGNLLKLKSFSCYNCNVGGSIPSSFGNLIDLEFLILGLNNFSGVIPSELGNLTRLIELDLSNELISGIIPSELGNLTSLERLDLFDCSLTGFIPNSLSNLTQLQYLELARNELEGTLPDFFGTFNNLESLYLGSNNFTGTLPSSYGLLPSIANLHIDDNQLEGCFPEEWLNLCSNDIDLLSSNNPMLPWEGVSSFLCNEPTQTGASCNDNDSNTEGDIIQEDCTCRGTDICAGFSFQVDIPDTITCLTSQIALNASSSFSEDLSFSWATIGGNIENGTNTASPIVSSAGIYQIIITDNITSCTVEDIVVVTENVVTPNISVENDMTLTCSTTAVTLQGMNSSESTLNFLWTSENGNIISEETNSSITVDEPGVYELIVTNQENGCSTTANTEVVENTIPPIINVSQTGTALNCLNPTITIDASASQTQGSPEYLWIDGSTSNLFTINASGSFGLTLTDNENGCSATQIFEVEEDIGLPIVQITQLEELNCINTQTNITAITTDNTISTYSWSSTDGSIEGAENEETVTISSTGSYVLIVTAENGCTNTEIIEVTENTTLPVINILSSANLLDCINSNITLDASTSQTQGNAEFIWSDNSTDSMLEVNTADTYSLTIIDNENGCSETETFEILEDTEIPPIFLDIISNNVEITCTDSSVFLEASSTDEDVSFEWFLNSEVIGNNSVVEAMGANTYTALVTGSNGCTNSSEISIESNINSPAIQILNLDTITCVQSSILLSTITDVNNATYNWNTLNGNIIMGEDTAEPIINRGGIYSVIVTDEQNGCTNTANISVIANTETPLIQIVDSFKLICGEQAIQLNVEVLNAQSNYSYFWNSEEAEQIINIDTNTPIIQQMGLYSVLVTDIGNGCTATTEIMVENFKANIGIDDFTICNKNETLFFEGNLPIQFSNINGQWEILNKGSGTTNENVLFIDNLLEGENRFVWLLSTPECPVFSSDTLYVMFSREMVQANDDVIESDQGSPPIEYNILANDEFNNVTEWSVDIITLPEVGTLTYNETTGDMLYQAEENFTGQAIAEYELCELECGNCTKAKIIFDIQPILLDAGEISLIITPNGDGKNDNLFLEAVNQYPDNEVFVYNRWGSLVWKGEDYDNNLIRFEGNNLSGNRLPEGTYYFTANLSFGEGKILFGSVTIRR